MIDGWWLYVVSAVALFFAGLAIGFEAGMDMNLRKEDEDDAVL